MHIEVSKYDGAKKDAMLLDFLSKSREQRKRRKLELAVRLHFDKNVQLSSKDEY